MRHALGLWNPNEIDRFFDQIVGNTYNGEKWMKPTVEVDERKDAYLLHFDLPGVSKDDVHIELDGDQLVVSGERKQNRREDREGSHWTERRYGKFRRVFSLPADTDADRVNADFKDGVLMIQIAKTEAAKPKQIKIGDGSSGGFFKKFTSGKPEDSEARKTG